MSTGYTYFYQSKAQKFFYEGAGYSLYTKLHQLLVVVYFSVFTRTKRPGHD